MDSSHFSVKWVQIKQAQIEFRDQYQQCKFNANAVELPQSHTKPLINDIISVRFNCQELYLNMINLNSDSNDEILLVSYCTVAQKFCQVFAMYSHNYKSFMTFKKDFAMKENTGKWKWTDMIPVAWEVNHTIWEKS